MDDVRKYLSEISAVQLSDGFIFESLELGILPHAHMKYPGYSVSVMAKLSNTKTKVFIDIGVGDAVKPTEITMQLLSTEKAPLFEKDIHLWAYPIEAIFAEKLETAVSRADQNSRMKDYHDLLVLIREKAVDIAKLRSATTETFRNRGTELQKISFADDQYSLIQNNWTQYLRALSPEARGNLNAEFSGVVGEINSFLQNQNLLVTPKK